MPSSAITTVVPANSTARPGRVDRLQGGLARVLERRPGRSVGLAEAGEDEERVVDPTPSPIIAASSEEKFGVLTTCVNSAISPRPVPRPNSAVTIGSPIAVSEPNVSSSTTTAASRPTPVATPKPSCSVSSIACPPSSTSRPGRAAARATAHHAFGGALGQEVRFLVEHDGRERDLPVARRSPCRPRLRRRG